MSTTYVPLTEAADELGVSTNTLKRRFRSLGLTTFRDSRDLRRRLIRRSDLEAAFGPPVPTAPPPRVPDPGPVARSGARRHRDR
jgi:hypothetical protein